MHSPGKSIGPPLQRSFAKPLNRRLGNCNPRMGLHSSLGAHSQLRTRSIVLVPYTVSCFPQRGPAIRQLFFVSSCTALKIIAI